MFIQIVLLVLFVGLAVAGFVVLWRMQRSVASRRRLFDEPEIAAAPRSLGDMNFVRRWLYLAGFRSDNAELIFWGATLLALVLGFTLAFALRFSGLQDALVAGVEVIPGGVGQMFLPAAIIFPWFVGGLLACTPWLFVRSRRRQRVELVEQDLPLALELLATLSEAGLGFDSALSRIIKTRLANRPLAAELRSFQSDLLAGRPRVEALRRLSQRMQIPTVSIFVSAMVQAEQVGMGVATVLRRQANDLRNRRRERANAFAATLPVKRMIPLVVCFLPGLFVWTLGPFFVQLFKIADTFIQVREF